jgi:hypothetical protein
MFCELMRKQVATETGKRNQSEQGRLFKWNSRNEQNSERQTPEAPPLACNDFPS